jgi:superfamily II DNA or RNA helicase
MVDFGRLVSKKQSPDARNLIGLFNSLDRQASHTSLRPVQVAIIKEIQAHRNDRDLVLKMSTGAGKTSVALTNVRRHRGNIEQRRG